MKIQHAVFRSLVLVSLLKPDAAVTAESANEATGPQDAAPSPGEKQIPADLKAWQILAGQWAERNGALHSTQADRGSIILTREPLPVDFSLKAKLTLARQKDVGLLFRAQDAGRYHLVQISSEYEAFRVQQITGPSSAKVEKFPCPIERNREYEVEVVGRGSHYEVWIDGLFLHEFINTDFSGGYAGFRTWGIASIREVTIGPAPPVLPVEKRPPHPAEIQRPFLAKPVRVVTIAPQNPTLEKMVALVEKEAAAGTDLIVLPETWPGLGNLVTLDDPPITALAALAKKYRTYIISPVDRKDETRVYNSAVLLDRTGQVAGIYNKVQPVGPNRQGVGGEFKPGVDGRPGNDAPVFETDFGRIGMAICFDGQFPEVWQRLADNGADLVLFSSMYSAGKSLGAYATLHHIHIVSCCNSGECQAYDFTGQKLLEERRGLSRITLDLGRRMFHNNDPHNYGGKREKLLRENPGVVIDQWMAREDWHVLRATRADVDLPALIKKYDLRELRDYIHAERDYWDAKRGFRFNRLGPPHASSIKQGEDGSCNITP